MQLTVTKSEKLKAKPDDSRLCFGTIFTDHMFNMDYNQDDGWHNPRIEPYGSFNLDPATMVLHMVRAFLKDSKLTEQIPEPHSFSVPETILNG